MHLDFIIGGAQKAGTTSLHTLLSRHPNIHLPGGANQETHYYDLEENYRLGLSWLKERIGAGSRREGRIGITCPIYMYLPEVAPRVFDDFPQMKWILILRDPVDRAYSGYWHERKKGREKWTFEKALQHEEQRIGRGYWEMRRYSYFARGLYGQQLQRLFKFFERDQIHVLFFEELFRNDKEVELGETLRYLGVDEDRSLGEVSRENRTFRPRSRLLRKMFLNRFTRGWKWSRDLQAFEQRINGVAGYPPMAENIRRQLRERYLEDTEMLARILGRDIPWSYA